MKEEDKDPSPPRLSKYERVQVLAARVQQLNGGAPAAVAWTEGESTYDIALREMERGHMPIVVSHSSESSSSSSSS